MTPADAAEPVPAEPAAPEVVEAAGPERAEPTGDGWARRRQRISEHIEQVALRLFAQHGYPNVTVADVAEAADVSPRTIARYFPTKEDLLLALPRRAADGALEALEASWARGHTVRDLWDTWAEVSRDHPVEVERFVLFEQAITTAPEIIDRAWGERHKVIQQALAAKIRESMEDDPDADLHATVVAAALQAANGAVVEYWLSTGGAKDLAELFASSRIVLAQELGSIDGRRRPRRRPSAS